MRYFSSLSGWVGILVLLLVGCAPSYNLSIRPSRGSGQWESGQETALGRSTQDSVEVRLSFVRFDAGQLVFEADIRNQSSRPLLVAPTAFYYQPVLTRPVATSELGLSVAGAVAAFDPEPRLQQLTQQVAYESAEATKVTFNEVLTDVSHVVEDVASIRKKETQKKIDERALRQEAESNRVTRYRLERAARADVLRHQQQEMENRALRRNTLAPGQRLRGYLYFPRADQADLLRVSVELRGQPVVVDFTQVRTRQ